MDEGLEFLSQSSATRAQFHLFASALRRRKLHGGVPCAKGTIELVRAVLGSINFPSTHLLLEGVKALGRHLQSAAPSELTIGNVIRRVLFLIREEYSSQLRLAEEKSNNGSSNYHSSSATEIQNFPPAGARRRSRGNSMSSNQSNDSDHSTQLDQSKSSLSPMSLPPAPSSSSASSSGINTSHGHSNIAMPNPSRRPPRPVAGDITPLTFPDTSTGLTLRTPSPSSSPMRRHELLTSLSPADLVDPTQQPSLGRVLSHGEAVGGTKALESFSKTFPGMRQAVLEAIKELMHELETVYDSINKEAQEHVHAGECILAYGHATAVEIFLKAAARKRKFQVVIAEAAPGLEGHKLALSLSKVPNISVTLIPDSGIYAIMSRINKVILSPHAVMADGGALCSSGLLMVATAAKEFSVPVVGITGAFTLAPLFAHNQTAALGELLSPASVIPYNSPAHFENVEVAVPAFDVLPPDLLALYVTNVGSHQPSYMYRLLGEFYHPQDHVI